MSDKPESTEHDSTNCACCVCEESRREAKLSEAVATEREAIAVMVEKIEPMAQRDGKGVEHAEVTRAICCTIAALIRARK